MTRTVDSDGRLGRPADVDEEVGEGALGPLEVHVAVCVCVCARARAKEECMGEGESEGGSEERGAGECWGGGGLSKVAGRRGGGGLCVYACAGVYVLCCVVSVVL